MTQRAAAIAAGLLLAAGVLSVAFVSVRQPFGVGDYVAIWGLKARALHRGGTLASLVRVDPAGEFSHPEYAPLWPVVLAGAAGLAGRYDELLLTPLWPALCLLAALATARATRGPLAAKLLAASLVSLLPYYRKYPGYAEALLAVFLAAALAEVDRLGVERMAPVRLSLFLVLAAWTKPEGILAGLIAAGLLILSRRRRAGALAGLSVLLLGAAPWPLALEALGARGLPGAFALRAFSPAKLAAAARAIAAESGSAAAWIGGGALLLALASATLRRRRALLLGTALFLAAVATSYGFSRFDPAWHARWSWDRITFLAVVAIAPALAEAAWESLAFSPAAGEPA